MSEFELYHIDDRGQKVDLSDEQKELADKAKDRCAEKIKKDPEMTEDEYMAELYSKDHDEYLVNNGVLQCSMATPDFKLLRGKAYNVPSPDTTTFLNVTENPKAKCCGYLYHATVKDRKAGVNIPPFRCNCDREPHNEKEWSKLEEDESCLIEGTCKALINLCDEWDNLPTEKSYMMFWNEDRQGMVPGITMSSMLFCRHGGIITPVESGQTTYPYAGPGEFVGYLAYGGKSITQNPEEGYYMLYDGPTIAGVGDCYMFADIYDECGIEGKCALQGYGGTGSVLNTMGGHTTYGGATELDTDKGTLIFNEIERHAVAIGPSLQNPKFDTSTTAIDPKDMAYGTCVDVTIELNEKRYYIPAIITDVKGDTAYNGYYQTNVKFDGSRSDPREGDDIVEWYVKQGEGSKNKASGLKEFDLNGGIIIYRDVVMD